MASGLKYAINALQTIIGQKTLARMRGDMLGHILRLQKRVNHHNRQWVNATREVSGADG